MTLQTILLTGAAGKLGRRLRQPLAERYPQLRSSDILPLDAQHANEEARPCDLSDAAAVAQLVQGVDAIVHFAGYPREAGWDTLVPANLVGTAQLWEAALNAGVKRIVYASSNHVIGFHPVRERIGIDAEVKCDSRYGVTKAFAETLARFYYEKYGLPSLGLRIGRCEDRPTDERMLSSWLHPDDMTQLVVLGLEQPLEADILYGVSRNSRALWWNPPSERLPFLPAHSADDYAQDVLASLPTLRPAASPFHGGYFADADYRGDPARAIDHSIANKEGA
jgi:uronate dehydrogenase